MKGGMRGGEDGKIKDWRWVKREKRRRKEGGIKIEKRERKRGEGRVG